MMETTTGRLGTTGRKVLVEVVLEAEKTEGGLFRPDAARKKLNYGPIAAIGDEIGPDDILQVGVQVVWPEFASHLFEWGDKTYAAVHRDDIQAVLQEG